MMILMLQSPPGTTRVAADTRGHVTRCPGAAQGECWVLTNHSLVLLILTNHREYEGSDQDLLTPSHVTIRQGQSILQIIILSDLQSLQSFEIFIILHCKILTLRHRSHNPDSKKFYKTASDKNINVDKAQHVWMNKLPERISKPSQ